MSINLLCQGKLENLWNPKFRPVSGEHLRPKFLDIIHHVIYAIFLKSQNHRKNCERLLINHACL